MIGPILRLAHIDYLLRTETFPTTAQLAEDCGKSNRTISRDIKLLKHDFGAPIYYDPEYHGFSFYEAYHWPALCLLVAYEQASIAIKKYPEHAQKLPFVQACLQADLGTVYPYATAELHQTHHLRRRTAPQWYSVLAFQELPHPNGSGLSEYTRVYPF